MLFYWCTDEKTRVQKGEQMRLYLVNLRDKKGYSMRRVAREANMTVSHYSKIENGQRAGRVTLIVMGRIANVLDVTVDQLYKYEESYLEEVYKKQEQKNGK